METNPTIFALDIGTRSVVGLMLAKHQDSYKVIDIIIREHTERAMVDGQIHDVLAVSKVIKEIKEKLEERHGRLSKVAVAAAGRALKTERAKISLDISGKPFVKKEDIVHLELSAVQQAQINLATKYQSDKSYDYYCVGYSVIHYYLDNQEIGNLVDQQGKEAAVEIISTFLPKVVVESLLSALQRADLQMEALTLEPIAAINVLIPQSMRRLNVALVDIGAGTSDIAITDEGTVVAYGMVPIAGDEITEAMSDQLLLDFPLAEKAKRELLTNETISIMDILGFEAEVTRKEAIEKIAPSIDKLAAAIRDEIFALNSHKPPKAVMLVGGGSLTPELPKRLAEALGLPENRVAIRGIDAIGKVDFPDDIRKGPELVTPIGIALASEQTPVHYISVTVNQKSVRLFDMKKLTVGDSLLAAGITMKKLYGKPGIAMIVKVNDQQITIPGTHGQSPILLKNGSPCSLEEEIKSGDVIYVEKGEDGKQPELRIHDLVDEIPNKTLKINGKSHQVKATILLNKIIVESDTIVKDHDEILFSFPKTVQEAFDSLNLSEVLEELKPFTLIINNQSIVIEEFSYKLYKNGVEVVPSTLFTDNDSIETRRGELPTVKKLVDIKGIKLQYTIPVFFDEQKITLSKPLNELIRNGKGLLAEDHLHNGDNLQLLSKEEESFIFQDLFRHVDIHLPSRVAGRFVLLKNGEECTFHEPIVPGDHLQIVWPEIAKLQER